MSVSMRKSCPGVLFFVCVLLTFGCGAHNPWVVQKMHANSLDYCSTKLSRVAKDQTSEIDLELLNMNETIEMFLTIHSRPISASPETPNETPLKIECKGQIISTLAIRHKGGQKFTVPPTEREFILDCLRDQQKVTLILPGYQTIIDPEGFSSSYSNFAHPTYLHNPFHLPF